MPPQSTSTKIEDPQAGLSEAQLCQRKGQGDNLGKADVDKKESNAKTDDWNCMDHILWMNVFWFILLHVGALYGAYLSIFEASWKTFLFGILEDSYYFRFEISTFLNFELQVLQLIDNILHSILHVQT